ncbi:uncharacterized protein LOC117103259 [Anneissia japonica]|uniref:uncharacterized protein LOC117103259 n=1 Tax=Anneissia japonica TaxID=1529436 RepID=UPI0014255B62|nr:uncharacterized protein LOC117103259 [Anneissia japonica]XP_033099717.1 uncharacterized protein LOC117103259 [Anneissia japonica]XP_033099718.1 uncharacterized protein LOC117103259 [Anneissia japonica]
MRLQYCMEPKTPLDEIDRNLLTNSDGSVIGSRVFDASHLKQELLTMSDYVHVNSGAKNVTNKSQKLKLDFESEREKWTIPDGLNSCGCSSRESCSPEFADSRLMKSDVHSNSCGVVCKADVSNRLPMQRHRAASEDMEYSSAVYTNLSFRTLRDIRNSLEGKVKRLREEKEETSAKIEQAQIEDSVRRVEKQRLRQQLNLHRRDRLKKMIHDLHRKLENQSIRLQFCYTAILGVQRSVLRTTDVTQRREESIVSTDCKEAPF